MSISDDLERELHRLQKDHLRKMYELQREIERIRAETYLLKIHDQPSKIILHQSPPPMQIQAAPIPAPAPAPLPIVSILSMVYSKKFFSVKREKFGRGERIGLVWLIALLDPNTHHSPPPHKE